MNGMQGLVLGVAVGGAVAGGIAVLALQEPPDTSALGEQTPAGDAAAASPGALAKLEAAEARADAAEAALAAMKSSYDHDVDAVSSETGRLVAELQRSKEELTRLRAENAKLGNELAAARAGTAGATPADDGSFRFGLSGDTPVFDKADWPKLGGHLVELAKAITTLPEAIASGKGIDMATRQKLQQHNTPRAGFAVGAAEELGGTGPNGAFTHPAVMANLMRAALASAELPLTPEQEQHIAAIGDAWTTSEAERQSRYAEATPALRKTIDEVDLKQRFIHDVRKTLTKAQDAVVFPPSTVGRAQLDLFSPALVYALRQPVVGMDRDTVEKEMLQSLRSSMGWSEDTAAQYAYLVTEWCDSLPKAMQPLARTHPDVTFPHIDDIQAAARAQLAITEKLLALGELEAAQADALRANTTLLQPQLIKQP